MSRFIVRLWGKIVELQQFNVVFGRELIKALPDNLSRPYTLVTMADLWPKFEADFTPTPDHVHFVDSLEIEDLEKLVRELPGTRSIVGLGGGMAIDVAKYLSWRLNIPLFQVPTSMSVNAPFESVWDSRGLLD